MKTTFLILSILTEQFCHCQDTIFLNKDWKPTTRNDALFYRIDKKSNNKWTRNDYFINGKIQMTGTYNSIEPEIKDGNFETYFSNGKLKHIGKFTEGKEIGQHLWYNSEGLLEAKENYINGLLNGEYEEYHPNGKLMDKTSFTNGVQNGWTTYYRESGFKHSEGNFKKGKRDGNWRFYDENGTIKDSTFFKTEFEIPEANLYIELPNDEWELTDKNNSDIIEYVFKRNKIIDPLGRIIIPGIVIYIEDAKKYDHDIVLYSINKRLMFKDKGLKVNKILSLPDKDYPIPFKNSLITLTSYSSKGFDHILYMIHIINKDNKGIQIYLDMPQELLPKYENEFWETLSSLKELK